MSRPALRHPLDEEWVMLGGHSELRVGVTDVGDACVLVLDGALDASTYAPIRDAIVSAALDEPQAVVIDITGLTVREDPAWAVFTSARWQIAEWPNVPIGLVCAHDQGVNALQRNGITRYVPVYPTLEEALAELAVDVMRRYRRRAGASLPALHGSIRRCRELSAQWLNEWSRADFVHVVAIVVTELVEAALGDTDSEFSFRVETDGSTVSVAVQHGGILHHPQRKSLRDNVSSLDLVAANSRAWGAYAATTGNTVWAVVGPENRF
ncbi:STAS domain-containing protein [Mycobacterium sp.]|uniref:STAS domain-containing protein n=1 Tax=Mycobacterium sp. TaxID=1785 RepID=UPI003BAFA473